MKNKLYSSLWIVCVCYSVSNTLKYKQLLKNYDQLQENYIILEDAMADNLRYRKNVDNLDTKWKTLFGKTLINNPEKVIELINKTK